MPIAVAIDRSNNTDPWLIFFLLLAASTALRGRGLSLVVAMALLGVAFNTKMLAALVCGPALLAGWLLAGTLDWRRRILWMTMAGVTLAVVSLAWAAAFDLTPRDQPALCRQQPRQFHARADRDAQRAGSLRATRAGSRADTAPAQAPRVELYDAVPIGPLRLANPALAMQFAWTLPLAVLGAVFGWRRRRASVALWSVWALTYGIVYSLAGGIFHAYYLSTLGPPLAALAGIGCFELWRRGSTHLAVGLGATALLQACIAGASFWAGPRSGSAFPPWRCWRPSPRCGAPSDRRP